MIKLSNKMLCTSSILTTLSVLFQAAPIYLSSVGLFLSPLSTFTIALATITKIPLGIAVYLASIIILLYISIEEMLIFTFSTGLLGFTIGVFLYRKDIILSSLALCMGILILSFLKRIDGFINFTSSILSLKTIMIILVFSTVYVFIVHIFVIILIKYINKRIQVL